MRRSSSRSIRARARASRGEGLLGLLEAPASAASSPPGYLDFLSLQLGAGAIVTDSGGVQEEAAALGVRCYTLRANTERPITITHGTNVLLGEDPAALAVSSRPAGPPTPCAIPLWDGHAGERVAEFWRKHFALEARPADVVLA